MKDLPQDVQVMLILLSILAGLLILSIFRIIAVTRHNRRLRAYSHKLASQAKNLQTETTAIHHDAMSWRSKSQRQFEALRHDFSHRLQEVERGGSLALKTLEETYQNSLAAASMTISELEAKLDTLAANEVNSLSIPPADGKTYHPSLPPLPAMETLRLQALEAELAAARTEIALSRQQNATLQRTLQLTRRRLPAIRKSSSRNT